MTTPLEVLLIESHPGVGDVDADQLEAAGHQVHRCYRTHEPRSGRVPLRDRYLCTGVIDGSCPLDDGMDVALLVRQRIVSKPAARESGVSCALRAGVPVVEDGPDLLDPYEPWLASRLHDGDVARTCEAAATKGFESLRNEIRRRIGPLLCAAGVDPAAVSSRLETDWPRLNIVVSGAGDDKRGQAGARSADPRRRPGGRAHLWTSRYHLRGTGDVNRRLLGLLAAALPLPHAIPAKVVSERLGHAKSTFTNRDLPARPPRHASRSRPHHGAPHHRRRSRHPRAAGKPVEHPGEPGRTLR